MLAARENASKYQVLSSNTYREKLFRVFFQKLIASVERGHLTIVLPSGEQVTHQAAQPGGQGVIFFHNWRAIRRTIIYGGLGFVDSFIDGDWSSPDLAALLTLVAQAGTNDLNWVTKGFLPLRLWARVKHLSNANTRWRSRRNIKFHYDLGNWFFRLWLDRDMIYSSALYSHPDQTLEEAQAAKLTRIVELLDLKGGDDVLEIGCGWGALAVRLARDGAKVTGFTLSAEQLRHARKLAEKEKLLGSVDFQLKDYRDASGQFDRIVSIEMLEAVGEAYWPLYFDTLYRHTKPGGKIVVQTITIAEKYWPNYRRNVDFIQRHMFPGGMLPTKTIVNEQARCAGLRLISCETFGESYALTLAEWRRRFNINVSADAKRTLIDESFRRRWEYYFCYCEAGFRTGAIDVCLFTFEAP